MLKSFFALLAVTVAAAAAAATASATTDATALATVPVSAPTSTGGTFSGTLTITGVTVQDGQVVALGTLSGTVTDAAGATIGNVENVAVAAPVQQQGTSCTLFAFSIGPIDLNVAGLLTVHVDPIGVKVGVEGILGTLLCGLLGGGTPPPVPA